MELKGKFEHLLEYRETEAINSSTLKRFLYPPFNKQEKDSKYYEENIVMEVGTVVDALETMEEGTFDKYYYVDESMAKPSKSIVSILQYVFDKSGGKPLEECGDLIIEAAKIDDYQRRWTPVVLIMHVKKDGQEYYNTLLESGNKFILDADMMKDVNQHIMNLYTSEYTKDLFNVDFNNKLVVLNQVPIYTEIMGHKAKVLIDRVYINYSDEDVNLGSLTIPSRGIIIADLKTTSVDITDFENMCKKFNYPLQLSFYLEAFVNYAKQGIGSSPVLDEYIHPEVEDFSTFDIYNPIIIVSSVLGGAHIVTFSDETIHNAKYGSDRYIVEGFVPGQGHIPISIKRKKTINGWIQAMKNWLFYKNTATVYNKNIIDNKGYITFDLT